MANQLFVSQLISPLKLPCQFIGPHKRLQITRQAIVNVVNGRSGENPISVDPTAMLADTRQLYRFEDLVSFPST